jgi:uncharacterized damage-inducible protein DinB
MGKAILARLSGVAGQPVISDLMSLVPEGGHPRSSGTKFAVASGQSPETAANWRGELRRSRKRNGQEHTGSSLRSARAELGNMVGMKAYFARLARYNRWANRRLYEAVGLLSPAEFQAPRSGAFGSLCATLNHLYVGDRCWLARFEQITVPHRQLDEVPHPFFDHLWAARQVEDSRVIRLINEASEVWFAGVLRYRRMADGIEVALPIDAAIGHFFNHQAHHRGQAHAMLSGTSVAPPPLDLTYFLPEDSAALLPVTG